MLLIDVHGEKESVDASDDILKANRVPDAPDDILKANRVLAIKNYKIKKMSMEDLRCCKKGYVGNEKCLEELENLMNQHRHGTDQRE